MNKTNAKGFFLINSSCPKATTSNTHIQRDRGLEEEIPRSRAFLQPSLYEGGEEGGSKG